MIGTSHSIDRIARALAAQGPHGSSDFDLNPGLAAPVSAIPLRPASVLVPLIARGGGLNLILTRRAQALRYHAGQIAFPGGKQDATDASAEAAALREAREEIGLQPPAVRVIGAMPVHETVTRFRITPFVGIVEGAFQPVADRREVEEVFEVPLDMVLDPANLQVHARLWNGHLRRYYVIPVGPYYIWGATARMLKALSDKVLER